MQEWQDTELYGMNTRQKPSRRWFHLESDPWGGEMLCVVNEKQLADAGSLIAAEREVTREKEEQAFRLRTSDNPWQNLANAIVQLAVMDYCDAEQSLGRRKNTRAEERKQECLAFFHSEYFKSLSDADPDKMVAKLLRKMNGKNERIRFRYEK